MSLDLDWLLGYVRQYWAIIKQEGWTIISGHSSQWTGPTDVGPNPLAITGYLAQNGLSYQEANNLLSWAEQALQEKCRGALIACDKGRSLEYYMAKATKSEPLLKFQEIKAFVTDMAALNGVGTIAGYVATPVPKKKRKNLDHCKVIYSDEEDIPDGWEEDSEDAGPLMDIDLNYRGPSQM
ncbi:hypothetical protein V8B97DRAFT_2009127 [Scleroderma yunnanense]